MLAASGEEERTESINIRTPALAPLSSLAQRQHTIDMLAPLSSPARQGNVVFCLVWRELRSERSAENRDQVFNQLAYIVGTKKREFCIEHTHIPKIYTSRRLPLRIGLMRCQVGNGLCVGRKKKDELGFEPRKFTHLYTPCSGGQACQSGAKVQRERP